MASLVAEVREFNRFYTATIGVLRDGLLRTPYSLTEARVIFELAQHDETEVAGLRRRLGVDAGYLSRILARFAADGLVARTRSAVDARRQVIRLTPAGRKAYRLLDERSTGEIQRMLDRLGPTDQRRLLHAMTTIRGLLTRSGRPAVVLREPRPGDAGWVVARHGELYAAEYGWDASFEALVAGIVADFMRQHDPSRERAWLAEIDRERVGCVCCVRDDESTARLRVLLVEPDARGTGVGGRLVAQCVEFARSAGYRRLVLLTYDVLADARRLYQRAGFGLVHQEPVHRYGHDLVEQEWALTL
ncbi:MAG: MarR family transcriptional regulator [Actinobacteria bacterium]|nr:MAG: MarR family transcriptional regulator [Actinomycetota bacterium]